MATVEITINGIVAEVAASKTVLEAAKQAGVEIPALCYDPRLKPFGACRMCLVEVSGARGPVAACTTPVKAGMVVNTMTEEIKSLRKTALEMLLAEHYGDCIGPCQTGCPAHIDIQGFIALIADGKNAESLELIKKQMPFPASVGRVCPRFCEDDCRRNLVDEPVAICHLKRYVADVDLETGKPYLPEVAPATGKTVAVVGGGPAGLTAAYYLAISGHSVTVYESYPQLGGMLRYAIPEYRLPKALLDKEIATITALCKEVKCNQKLGKDITIEGLKSQYDAVILAVGAAASQMIGCPGDDLTGNYGGLDFLSQYAAGEGPQIGKRVAVVGGGNTAIDCARTAVRLGADEVTIVYRRGREEMPASLEEIEGAEEEGVKFRFLTNPTAVASIPGTCEIGNMVCCEMALGEPDASGRRRPQVVPGSDFPLDVDTIIWATGQSFDPIGMESLDKARNGFLKTDSSCLTNESKVFAAGDCVTGPTTVVEAVGAAHKTAQIVDAFLNGQPAVEPADLYNHTKGELKEIDKAEYALREKMNRNDVKLMDAAVRAQNFLEIDAGFIPAQAMKEVERCLSCGCQEVYDCLLRKYSTDYAVKQPERIKKKMLPIQEDHPLVIRDNNKCITCGSCVRICSEIQAASALGFEMRGYRTVIEPSLGLPLSETTCESCQQCISACPVGALTQVIHLPKPGPFVLTDSQSVCPECSVGCEICLGTTANMLVKLDAPLSSGVNDGNLCKKGALLLRDLAAKKRVDTAMIRVNGELQPASLKEAMGYAAIEIERIKKAKGSALSMWLSSRLTNEEAQLSKAFANRVLGIQKVKGLSATLEANMAEITSKHHNVTSDEIAKADLLFMVGVDLADDYPVAAIKVRKAIENGAQMVTLGTQRTRLDHLALSSLAMGKEQISQVLRVMVNYILQYDLVDDSIDRDSKEVSDLSYQVVTYGLDSVRDLWIKPNRVVSLIHTFVRAKRPLILVDLDRISPEDLKILSALAWITGNTGSFGKGVLGFSQSANARGMFLAGIGSGQPKTGNAVLDQLSRGMELYGHGGIAITAEESSEVFALAITPYMTDEVAAHATVVLPGSIFAETSGTMTNSEGLTQPLEQAVTTKKTNAQLLVELSKALGGTLECTEAGCSKCAVHKAAAEKVRV